MSAALARRARHEELANVVSHGLGTVLAAITGAFLVLGAARHGSVWHVASFSVYGASLVLLFAASTAYHAAWSPRLKGWLRIMDHAAIYLLIAGTYTPFTLVTLRGPWGYSLLGVVWGIALAGVVAKVFLTGRYETLSITLYVVMGWCGVVAVQPLVAGLPEGGLMWLILGGMAYTSGVAFYAWERLPFNHLAWHLAVLAGAACHARAVYSLLA